MEISKIEVKGIEYDIKDEVARNPIEVVDYSTIQDTDFNLSPNKIYMLGTKDGLNITFLAPSDETKGAIYNFSFTAGDAVTTPIFYRGNTETAITIDKGNLEFVKGNKYEISYNWASGILIAQ